MSEMEESSWATGTLYMCPPQVKKQPTLKTREWNTFLMSCKEDMKGQISHHYSGEMPQTAEE